MGVPKRTILAGPRLLPEGSGFPDRDALPPAPPIEVADNDLVQRALQGHDEAFSGLVARYHRKAFWIAYHVLGRLEDSRDVVQESFLRVHRSLEKFDFSRNFYTWFYRIVMNLAIDSLRKHRASRTTTGLEDRGWQSEERSDHGDEAAEQQETRSLVWRVLELMDGKFKSVLVLRDIEGLSCREIAPILGVTHATVRWRLHRGRQIFRDHWQRIARHWQ
jgi:RNA polymerase sigma-70 factor (ECF subfamily)